MLECKLCDYYRRLSSAGRPAETAKCAFTDFIFLSAPETLDMEYPCRDVSYADYCRKQDAVKAASRLVNDDWRFLYSRVHPASGRDRYRRRTLA